MEVGGLSDRAAILTAATVMSLIIWSGKFQPTISFKDSQPLSCFFKDLRSHFDRERDSATIIANPCNH